MGQRVNITITYSRDASGETKQVEIQANSHHPEVSFAKILTDVAHLKGQPTAILRDLLLLTYPSAHGTHKAGAPIFLLGAPHPDADLAIYLD